MRPDPNDATDQPDIHGVWRLQDYYLENVQTGERTEAFGPNPNGVIIFLPEGRMAAILTPSRSKKPETEAEEASAFRKLIAYSGLYTFEPPDRFVTTVDVAWFEPWLGSIQIRNYELRDDVLHITTEPGRSPLTGDAILIGCIEWTRESRITDG
jgi:hypothetical protein